MAIVDADSRTVTLKIVYYGCALSGKTTNVEMLQRLTNPTQKNGLVSIATREERTLFFDLLPIALGQIGGNTIRIKLYTVPGQVHYETTRRQILAGTDGVVLIADSHPDQLRTNQWAVENLRLNLRHHGFDPTSMPTVLQWNKRDLPEALPVGQLESQVNDRDYMTLEAVAIRGQGVAKTFAEVVKLAIFGALRKAGQTPNSELIGQNVDLALAPAFEAEPEADTQHEFEHAFDMEAYRDDQASLGRAKEIVDQESLLSESVKTNMLLAERLDGFAETRALGERRLSMFNALSSLASRLTDVSRPAMPSDTLQVLAEGAGRERASVLVFRPGEEVMDAKLTVPGNEPDMLNAVVHKGVGSIAYRLSKETEPRLLEDVQTELFYGQPPIGAQDIASVLVVPIVCDDVAFGSAIIYSSIADRRFDEAEVDYWTTAMRLTALSLHWRALRRRLGAAAT